MRNAEVAALLYEIADLLELKGEMVFKVRAYRRAAQVIESLGRPIEDAWQEGRLEEIQGVGRGIAEHIDEFLRSGKSEYYEKMKKTMPMDVESLMRIEGMGPKKVKLLFDKLRIKTVKDLEAAARSGKIRVLPGMGEKTEQNILKGIEFAQKSGGRLLLGRALPIAEEIVENLRKLKYVNHVNYAGSLRRMKETIGDIDILVTSSDEKKVIDFFTKMPVVTDVIAQGPTKSSVHIQGGTQVDLRVLPESRYGSALMYFTGSKEHNIELRKIAIAKKWKLSEYGLFSGNRIIAGRTEEEVYKKMGLSYIEPEMREARGEIELAQKNRLPDLVTLKDIKSDLQMHTKWSDGVNTVEEMALAAKKLGYEYICITDHAGNLLVANALDAKRLDQQRKEIEKSDKKIPGIKILQGAEIDIRADGKLDLKNDVLKELDIVLASLHSALKLPEEKQTSRILAAMDNEHIDIIAHPTGRLIDRREGAQLDFRRIFEKAIETGTVIEINAQPDRMDLNDVNAFAAREAGCALSIGTDSHSTDQLRAMRLGVGIARRAWCTKKEIVNTLPYKDFAKKFGIKK